MDLRLFSQRMHRSDDSRAMFSVRCLMLRCPDGLVVISDYIDTVIKRSIKGHTSDSCSHRKTASYYSYYS